MIFATINNDLSVCHPFNLVQKARPVAWMAGFYDVVSCFDVFKLHGSVGVGDGSARRVM
jgi:hypothetical protein